MSDIVSLITYLLSAMGLTILIVWPEKGPSAWLRDKVARKILPKVAEGVLDCYICAGFWCGLMLSPVWWYWYREPWVWMGCLMIPGVFWIVLGNPTTPASIDHLDDSTPP